MNINFDFYEYAGIIVPGSVLTFGAMVLAPDLREYLLSQGINFGELGLFVVLSYAVGQLVQGLANLVEWFWWMPFGGLPGKRIIDGETLTQQQHARLISRIQADGIVGLPVSRADARAAVREIYACVAAAGRADRVDKFNGIYGMLRGLSAALLLLTAAAVVVEVDWRYCALLGFAAVVSLIRMHRFGWLYGRELVVSYLAMRPNT
ncbi:hypothetical protein [Thioclava nitratireducens]|uniref:hypothetical protein n=1 Tax=Thioclava nitratireducens TaxID=1915078 RepID=UPI00247FDB72|nr:hypothetical protein [Thioclava nitratireducens]WGT48658.1 hypothetical protein P0N61_09970 [Thioclava nitratireducens]